MPYIPYRTETKRYRSVIEALPKRYRSITEPLPNRTEPNRNVTEPLPNRCRTIAVSLAQAYPGRIPFLEFFERFELLQRQLSGASVGGQGGPAAQAVPSAAYATEEEAKAGCRCILEAFLPDKFYQIGHTRVSFCSMVVLSGMLPPLLLPLPLVVVVVELALLRWCGVACV